MSKSEKSTSQNQNSGENQFVVYKKYAKQTRALIANLNSQKCHFCGKEYVSKYILHTHLKTLHNTNPHECKECGFNTEDLNELKHHIQQVHILQNLALKEEYILKNENKQNKQQQKEDYSEKNYCANVQKKIKCEEPKTNEFRNVYQDISNNSSTQDFQMEVQNEGKIEWYVASDDDPKLGLDDDIEDHNNGEENHNMVNQLNDIKNQLSRFNVQKQESQEDNVSIQQKQFLQQQQQLQEIQSQLQMQFLISQGLRK